MLGDLVYISYILSTHPSHFLHFTTLYPDAVHYNYPKACLKQTVRKQSEHICQI